MHLLSTLIPTCSKKQKWGTLSVVDLVAIRTTQSCETSVFLSIWEEKLYDNTQCWKKLWTELCGAWNLADQQYLSKYTTVKTKENALLLKFHPCSSIILCEQQGRQQWWKETDNYTESVRYWLRNVTYHSLDTYQNWRCSIESRNSRHVWPKVYLTCPITYRTHTSSSSLAKLKHISMYRITNFSASRLFQRLLLSGRPARHAHKVHCRTKSAQIAHLKTLTVLCNRLVPKA